MCDLLCSRKSQYNRHILTRKHQNGDKKVTISELHNYVLKNVEDSTKTLYKDLPQIPILFTSNPDRVLYKLP